MGFDFHQVMYDKYSGRSRRFGFATMKSVEDANTVVEKLNGNVSFSNSLIASYSSFKL